MRGKLRSLELMISHTQHIVAFVVTVNKFIGCQYVSVESSTCHVWWSQELPVDYNMAMHETWER